MRHPVTRLYVPMVTIVAITMMILCFVMGASSDVLADSNKRQSAIVDQLATIDQLASAINAVQLNMLQSSFHGTGGISEHSRDHDLASHSSAVQKSMQIASKALETLTATNVTPDLRNDLQALQKTYDADLVPMVSIYTNAVAGENMDTVQTLAIKTSTVTFANINKTITALQEGTTRTHELISTSVKHTYVVGSAMILYGHGTMAIVLIIVSSYIAYYYMQKSRLAKQLEVRQPRAVASKAQAKAKSRAPKRKLPENNVEAPAEAVAPRRTTKLPAAKTMSVHRSTKFTR